MSVIHTAEKPTGTSLIQRCSRCGEILNNYTGVLGVGEWSPVWWEGNVEVDLSFSYATTAEANCKIQTCSFNGCEKQVCEADRELQQRMHFCQEHHNQLRGYIVAHDVKRILGFWVKANGGAKKLAETF